MVRCSDLAIYKTRQTPTGVLHLSFNLAFAAGTNIGCLGVPLRCLKQDSKIPIGFKG